MHYLQAVYDDPDDPATWIQPEEEKDGTFTFPDNSITDETTPLTPFRKRQQEEDSKGNINQSDMGAFYTSKDVRSLEVGAAQGSSLHVANLSLCGGTGTPLCLSM